LPTSTLVQLEGHDSILAPNPGLGLGGHSTAHPIVMAECTRQYKN